MDIRLEEIFVNSSWSRLFEENLPASSFLNAWKTGFESTKTMPGLLQTFRKCSCLLMALLTKNASISQGAQLDIVFGSLQPKLKLGRYPLTPGLLRNSLVPPAGRLVHPSVAMNGVSPSLGTVIARGDLRIV